MFEVSLINQNNLDKPLVVGKFSDGKMCSCNGKMCAKIKSLIEEKQLDLSLGAINKIYPFLEDANKVVYVVGLGEEKKYSNSELKKALKKVNYKLGNELNIKVKSFIHNLDASEVIKILIERISFYNYVYDELKKEKINNDLTLNLLFDGEIENDALEAINISTAINNARDLSNKPYNYLNAIDLSNYAFDLVKELNNDKVQIKVLTKSEIENLKMGAFLGVNKGSLCEPRLIHLSYNGANTEKITLVGKGIMFDTGGYSLKDNMVNMKDDMTGASVVLSVFEAVVSNKKEVNLDVVICATDNRISSDALLPDDVVTSMNGTTIEIVSTDAEGRLTLADAISYAIKNGAKKVIDIATLTGACVVALGDYITGLFGNNKEELDKMIKASLYTDEDMWIMPINDQLRKRVRGSKVADLTNSTGRGAGASCAAAFLEAFVEEGIKWMHLDIAGTSFHTSPTEGEQYGATGATIKTLYRYLTK